MADVIAYIKAQPDGVNMASSGNGTLQHLCLEMFRHDTGLKINHVPYRGGGPALTDVMAGQVKFFFSNGSSVVGLIKGGKVKAIAHTGKGRLDSLPDIPPVSDTMPGFEAYEWNGVFVPHGTPKPRSCRSSAPSSTWRWPRPRCRPLQAAQHRVAAEHAGGIPRFRRRRR